MNEDKELEESIKYLMKIANEYKTYGDLDNPEFEDIEKIPESIKTVLQVLENKNMKCDFIRKFDYDYILYGCSNCNEEWYFEDGTLKDNSYNYCPKCGAKITKVIELEEDEED